MIQAKGGEQEQAAESSADTGKRSGVRNPLLLALNRVQKAWRTPDRPQAAPTAETTKIGHPGEPLRALAFAGGGFNTAIQLGVAHALLVADAQPPDIVVGVSAGAVNAVALAEILQAGKELPPGQPQRAAQVARFREVLEAYRNAPEELIAGLLPDPYEVNARAPLKPQKLPIHYESERDERNAVVNARFGLIRLLNGLLAVRLKFSTVTQIVRRVLELRGLNECRNPIKRRCLKAYEFVRLWSLLGSKLFVLAPPVSRITFGVLLAGAYRNLAHRLETAAQIRELPWLRRFWKRAVTAGLSFALQLAGFYAEKDAKKIILQPVLARLSTLTMGWLIGFVWTLFLWLIPIAPLIESAYLVWHHVAWAWSPLLAYVVAGAVWTCLPRGKRNPAARLRLWATRQFLASFDLQRDLSTPYLLKPLFVRLFDRNYYGPLDIDNVVDRALKDESQGITSSKNDIHQVKTLRSYCTGKYPIYVAPAAADVSSGSLVALPMATKVVDALLAATAVVPFFRAQEVDGKCYIDGLNVANEPTDALMQLLRDLNPKTSGAIKTCDDNPPIEVYPVSPFALTRENADKAGQSGQEQDDKPGPSFSGLVGVVVRALQLQRLRDAKLERQMVELYNRALPPSDTFYTANGTTFVRASLHPIEPDQTLTLNERIIRYGDRDHRRKLIVEAVADGCRASLQLMMSQAIETVATDDRANTKKKTKPSTVSCRTVIRARLGIGVLDLPGSSATGGPGVAEVCRHCAVYRALKEKDTDEEQQRLAVPATPPAKADWPVRGKSTEFVSRLETVRQPKPFEPSQPPPKPWPEDRNGKSGNERATISLLFSGGVFRGVFQVGVVNALNEVGLKPDLIAGASVGSITAALVGEVFQRNASADRRAQIARLAATFLAIDRLVLTDRFADFVRRLTLRAAECKFSLRDVDQFFRRYDLEKFNRFNERSRRVIAGLERLFYLNPFELKELTKAFRNGETAEIQQQLSRHLQELLDRSGVGQEILGTEPLMLLIREHVLRHHVCANPDSAMFDLFAGNGTHLLATVTNLTRGELNILSSLPEKTTDRAVLKEGLLASSAFPAVFRPRWAWEVFEQSGTEDKFIDGGIMDNLPLDAVVHFLNRAKKNTWVKAQPRLNDEATPHLLFTASLEIKRRNLQGQTLRETTDNWLELMRRASQLRYNQKIDKFAKAQREFREIYQGRGRPTDWDLLDIEVVVVKPEWLPGTFAFNPMLGFRRVKQARSIAHGCASTLAQIHETAGKHPLRAKAWGVNDTVDENTVAGGLKPDTNAGKNICWFRKGANARCPFAPGSLKELDLHDGTKKALEQIYHECGKQATHQAE